jgi:hypothetical protein
MSDDEKAGREPGLPWLSQPDPHEVSAPGTRPLATLHDVAYLGGYVPVTTISTDSTRIATAQRAATAQPSRQPPGSMPPGIGGDAS